MLSNDPYGNRAETDRFRQEATKYLSDESDINTLVSVFKHVRIYSMIIEMNTNLSHKSHVKGIIYDSLNSIVAILNKRERYLHLNLRSMIEHIARIALNKTYSGGDFDGMVRRRDFDYLKSNRRNENWNYLHNVYINACHYVHFSPQANINTSATFLQLLVNDCHSSQKNLIRNLHRLTSSVMETYITYFHYEVASTFYRSMADLKYLLGNSLYTKFKALN
ncbi:hypothetical protein B2I68_23780 [Salmonella enterica]|nr:hypothetical protein [Salmonella enterica]ECN1723347.1 hypothetical protein [Salmonella enterica subsp. enterica serovar Typhimurium]EAZ2338770.1 hypothetical protein [Salmonella enterica]EBR2179072.1 hypothetical protein [Salmonella enterica]ECN1814633.1 hypothetical protein [Salmonella enterica subsp. enterica serovar Typhimurium]